VSPQPQGSSADPRSPVVELRPVTAEDWRDCAALEVADEQRDFVNPVTRYLCLCHYGGVWQPFAVYDGDEVVGFAMWAVDPADRSGWIGGLIVDKRLQRRGYGRATLRALVAWLRDDQALASCALSYAADNAVARRLYASEGFVETGELEDDELVARLRFTPQS
jgi:diamine N-acetyltransferase